MANTYSWVISQLECYPTHESKIDCHWRRQATDGNGHNADIYGAQSLTLDPATPFTAYADLTEAQVVGWLEAAMGTEVLEAQKAALDKQIEDLINPPVVRLALPWNI